MLSPAGHILAGQLAQMGTNMSQFTADHQPLLLMAAVGLSATTLFLVIVTLCAVLCTRRSK
jgi:hypothetical protein